MPADLDESLESLAVWDLRIRSEMVPSYETTQMEKYFHMTYYCYQLTRAFVSYVYSDNA